MAHENENEEMSGEHEKLTNDSINSNNLKREKTDTSLVEKSSLKSSITYTTSVTITQLKSGKRATNLTRKSSIMSTTSDKSRPECTRLQKRHTQINV
ncbi:unnamed protein product [Lupinus luteus]|uniref:Uncharacterized protein n=1 Tax=Lupinus luteus TaxID=3873 RepID=A0AAV1WL51_LUPLU